MSERPVIVLGIPKHPDVSLTVQKQNQIILSQLQISTWILLTASDLKRNRRMEVNQKSTWRELKRFKKKLLSRIVATNHPLLHLKLETPVVKPLGSRNLKLSPCRVTHRKVNPAANVAQTIQDSMTGFVVVEVAQDFITLVLGKVMPLESCTCSF